jgi:hypothetical protein
MAFRGLQAESAAQGQAHKTIAAELDTLVADPFDQWAETYKVCIASVQLFIPSKTNYTAGPPAPIERLHHRLLAAVLRASARGSVQAETPVFGENPARRRGRG